MDFLIKAPILKFTSLQPLYTCHQYSDVLPAPSWKILYIRVCVCTNKGTTLPSSEVLQVIIKDLFQPCMLNRLSIVVLDSPFTDDFIHPWNGKGVQFSTLISSERVLATKGCNSNYPFLQILMVDPR